MRVADFRAKLRYAIEHPKCKRCGRELYIPEPPEKLQETWGGIFAWTAFVKQYASIMIGLNLKTSTKISFARNASDQLTRPIPLCLIATIDGLGNTENGEKTISNAERRGA